MKKLLLTLLWAVQVPAAFAEPTTGLAALRSYADSLAGERRAAADFLLENLPAADRESLSLELFRENLDQAFVARETYPWTKELPRERFFNEVLPHAVVTETRDAWRKNLRELFHPLVKDCHSVREASAAVGANIGKLTGVEYNTGREKACQSPAESMRQHKASCTGLSILMVDALRAAGVPARLAAIPMWGTGEGNHTWVEVHDGTDWRFSGYGGSPDRWDQGWEIARSAYSDPAEPITGIYATSYQPTPIGFPTIWEWKREPSLAGYCQQERGSDGQLTKLDWLLQEVAIGGVDRTAHYIAMAGGRKLPIPKGHAGVAVRAFLGESERRVDVPVRVWHGDTLVFDGRTASEALDLNDYVRLTCEPGDLRVEHRLADGSWRSTAVNAPADKETPVRLALTEAEAGGFFTLDQRKALATWFRSGDAAWPALEWPALPDAAATERARTELWAIFRDARRLDPASRELGPLPPTLAELTAQADNGKPPLRPGTLTLGKHHMPFVLLRKESAPVPAPGRALYICMHGGGANPKATGPHDWDVNTREWMAQASLAAQTYPGEGLYFVPRMADDRLGRWHHALNQDAFDRVIEHGIREWGVDPDRVFILGISEGCYGTQILGPFMADRFAAASAMAGGVGDDVPAENLRNLPFRTDVGEKDTTFDRVGLARRFHARMDEAAKSFGGYQNSLNVQAGRGHGVDYLPGPQWMIQHHRDSRPGTVVWTSKVHDGRRRGAFYWLGLEVAPPADREIKLSATLKDQTLDLQAADGQGASLTGAKVSVMLDDKLIDFTRPLAIRCNGKDLGSRTVKPSLETLARTMADRGDPAYVFPAATVIDL